MHIHKRAWRNVVSAAAIVAFALPLTAPLATNVGAAPANASTNTTSSITGVGVVAPAVAFNPVGTAHTVTFTCQAAGVTNVEAVTAGCFDVTASAQDITTGSAVNVDSGTCASTGATQSGDKVTCNNTRLENAAVAALCGATSNNVTTAYNAATNFCEAPIASATSASGITAADCATATLNGSTGVVNTAGTACQFPPNKAAQATATFNPGANHAYTVSFSGYTLIAGAAGASCPNGTTSLASYTGVVGGLHTAPGGTSYCQFTVTAQKKYFEITKVTVSPINSSVCAGGALTFAEGLKAFFGPACQVTAAVTGTVVLKTGVDCTQEPANGSAAPTSAQFGDFPSGATYSCQNGTLAVNGLMPTGSVPVTFTVTGPGSTSCTASLGGLAAGSTAATSLASWTGTTVSICPTGAGVVSVTACLGTSANPLPNNQPSVCSSPVSVTYTENAARVVPYVRWAGEKIALTKCFGIGLAGSTIEFTLQGNNPGLNATLLPINLGSLTNAGGTVASGANQVFTTADARGCATVIGYADGEGVMNVDAAVYAAGGAQSLINEHAFQVFYLKFESVTLENINMTSSSVATALTPYLSFLEGSETTEKGGNPLQGQSASTLAPTSFSIPGAPGTGGTGFDQVPVGTTQYVRAMVHGYFEYPGDPSGRPASTVSIPGATAGSAGSYVLPAGRWVLPEDWPLLATFAGFGLNGQAADFSPSSVMAWDINSGYAFNPSSENPVICGFQGTLISPSTVESGAISDFLGASGTSNVGQNNLPCFGQDANSQAYATAPANNSDADADCDGLGTTGATTAPFDATEAYTCPFPLKYSPAGAATTTASNGKFAITPAGVNSSYLPNGTLNQWDAPMPPAAVSFGITGGPGYLQQVNKTGLYHLGFVQALPSSGTCPAGYTENASATPKDCELEVYTNPFYSEAIPASPLIPPTTNNGGYLWNSWGFNFGAVTTSTAAAAAVTATTIAPLYECGITIVSGSVSTTTNGTVAVGSVGGLTAGSTVNLASGNVTLSGVKIASVDATHNTVTFDCASLNAAFAAAVAAGQFGTPAPTDVTKISLAANATITSSQFTVTVSNASGVTAGTSITIISGNNTFTGTVVAVNGNTVTVSGAAGVAAAFGCTSGDCSIPTLLPSGVTVSFGTPGGSTGTGAPASAAPSKPYPFWQWVPGAPGKTDQPSSATVYSDNHGEAVVALQAAATTQVAPVSGACTTGYTAITVNGSVVNCVLPYSSLTQFQNIKALTAAGSGCLNTFPTGTTALATTATVGASGPTAGQICINAQGGIEFGSAAVLGTTTVNAVADYPYTREHAPVGAASLTKVWTSAFNKSVTVTKGATTGGMTAYTVTVTAQDITGAPLLEPIEVFAVGNASATTLSPMSIGTLISSSSNQVMVTPTSAGTATFSLEVLNSAVGTSGVVIKVVFPAELVERFVTVINGSTPGTTTTVVYPPGWQQVGGPAGSNFSVAEALFSWDPVAGAYTNATAAAGNISSAAPACTGYWAYFAAAMTVSLPGSSTPSGTTATCTLQKGWNLVGSPFGAAATIQSGVTAFHWNGTSYDTVGVIPLGGSVWVYNDGTLNSITLTQV